MIIKKENPYEKCPTYETKHFIIRMVSESDAEDLLKCYSDAASAKIFNSDNCTSNFIYKSLEEMKNCIRFWLDQYEKGYFIRFSIVDRTNNSAIGTIEFFTKPVELDEIFMVGLLRLDLASKYEKHEFIREIIDEVDENFYDVFEVEDIITKAIPEAKERIYALKERDFIELEKNASFPFDFYFIRKKWR
ncbi:GNAT family N-acetyltransferase [Clostridium sp. UBA6640]|uniref:GNAT family N-acetyltransferase n=1 Tax=Clostridium sp. UBA6640 TaxID=1946370 RepID=UPI0025C2CA83|nr:hypothetical protein [Clostridium sp. UBA6640]